MANIQPATDDEIVYLFPDALTKEALIARIRQEQAKVDQLKAWQQEAAIGIAGLRQYWEGTQASLVFDRLLDEVHPDQRGSV